MAFSLNPRTNTMESGTYYAGKNKADKAYGTILAPQSAAQKLASQKSMAALKKQMAASQQAKEEAATTKVESELQDEMAAQNALQAERTAAYAREVGMRSSPPGGSIKRGTATIAEASGSGLAKANIEARRKAKLAEAKAGVKATTTPNPGLGVNKIDLSKIYG